MKKSQPIINITFLRLSLIFSVLYYDLTTEILRKTSFMIFEKFWSGCFRISRKTWRNVSLLLYVILPWTFQFSKHVSNQASWFSYKVAFLCTLPNYLSILLWKDKEIVHLCHFFPSDNHLLIIRWEESSLTLSIHFQVPLVM